MDGLEEKLSSVLSNPELMDSIMSMARSIGGQESTQAAPTAPPGISTEAMGQMMQLLRSANISPEQQALLNALAAYLRPERIRKLENAMRAAKLADVAAMALNKRNS